MTGDRHRPYTREELDALFEHADKEVERIGRSGRKGWQAAYRDAVMMKVAYRAVNRACADPARAVAARGPLPATSG